MFTVDMIFNAIKGFVFLIVCLLAVFGLVWCTLTVVELIVLALQ